MLAFIGFNIQVTLFVLPFGEGAVGKNVPIGYPPRIMLLVYHLALIAVANKSFLSLGNLTHQGKRYFKLSQTQTY
ncbi:MAG: hypothetical protein SGI89_03735 [bacterium]|nr:hypothetical protein [bacterium]